MRCRMPGLERPLGKGGQHPLLFAEIGESVKNDCTPYLERIISYGACRAFSQQIAGHGLGGKIIIK